jgi:hypothetical protein
MKHCPECGSPRVSADGEMVEDIVHPDREPPPAYFFGWWICDACQNQWRYQDNALNPGGTRAKDRIRRIAGDEVADAIGRGYVKAQKEYQDDKETQGLARIRQFVEEDCERGPASREQEDCPRQGEAG